MEIKIKVGDKVDIINSPEYGVVKQVNHANNLSLIGFKEREEVPYCLKCGSSRFLSTNSSGEIVCGWCGNSHGFKVWETTLPISALKKVEK